MSVIERTARKIDRDLRVAKKRDAATLHALRRGYSISLVNWPDRSVIQLGLKLNKSFGHRFMASALIYHHPTALHAMKAKDVLCFGQGIDSWSSVDVFGCYIAGQAWRKGIITDRHIRQWTRSEDRWWRRLALVSTIPLNMERWGGHGDKQRTLAVCTSLVDDRDDMVIKALSWALRILIRVDRTAVKQFLRQYDERLAARVKREVRNKLTTGLKTPRRARKRSEKK